MQSDSQGVMCTCPFHIRPRLLPQAQCELHSRAHILCEAVLVDRLQVDGKPIIRKPKCQVPVRHTSISYSSAAA